jgi:Uncharacterized conserved protein
MNQIKSIIEYAIRMESDAREFYLYNADRVHTPSLKKLFDELAEMEKGHYEMLERVYEKMDVTKPPINISWVVDNTSKEVNTAIIADNSDLISDSKSITDLSVVRLAYLMESDFALFYKNASEQVEEPEAKKALKELSDWEKQHQELFRVKYETLLKKSWSDITNIIFK